ncbi:putative secreted protein [Planctopirus limnophila DSM 3776]|uniref:Putative secreted protein n=1 Tax=Planctopirus limnophila (strain ATCC 43296 / DSM 3776 / IFAM 1008 / Mu 290) TaxID=521674 RepID=D5SRQ6_PLAL2|nr:secreted protein [Planctopirus limnophila]ADG66590.1 putative secreted protein [Planctopirus limnophila DSM 3776]
MMRQLTYCLSIIAALSSLLLSGAHIALGQTGASQLPGAADSPGNTHAVATVRTYYGEVEPLLRAHCLECHRQGGLAPFSLESYAQAKAHALTSLQMIQQGSMPPWPPSARGLLLQHERRLTATEQQLFAEWIQQGRLAGDPSPLNDDMTSKVTPQSVQTKRPPLGEPDAVFELPSNFEVPAEGDDIYLYVPIGTGWTKDQWIQAIEFEPGVASVVHHASFMADTSGTAREMDAETTELGYRRYGGSGFTASSTLGGWAPGAQPMAFPPGVARKVDRGADLVLQMHYHPSGRVEHDRSRIKIHFAKEPVQKQVVELIMANLDLQIPADRASHRHIAEYVLPVDVTIYGIAPHAHQVATSVLIEAIDFEKGPTILLEIPRWNMNWQQVYLPRTPLTLRGGTRLRTTFVYNNSSSNPRNPHQPPQDIFWGEQTADEMGVVFFDVTTNTPEDLKFLQWHNQNRLTASREEAARHPRGKIEAQ